MGDYDLALADYAQAITLAPEQPDIYANRARVYTAQENLDAALADYNKAFSLALRTPVS